MLQLFYHVSLLECCCAPAANAITATTHLLLTRRRHATLKAGSGCSNYVGVDSRTKLKLSRMWALKNSPLLKLLFIAVYVAGGTFS
jgi:hypothetical protein